MACTQESAAVHLPPGHSANMPAPEVRLARCCCHGTWGKSRRSVVTACHKAGPPRPTARCQCIATHGQPSQARRACAEPETAPASASCTAVTEQPFRHQLRACSGPRHGLRGGPAFAVRLPASATWCIGFFAVSGPAGSILNPIFVCKKVPHCLSVTVGGDCKLYLWLQALSFCDLVATGFIAGIIESQS
jgi:hypothetical protein